MVHKKSLFVATIVTLVNLSTYGMIGGTPLNLASDEDQSRLRGAIKFEISVSYSFASFIGSGIHIGNGYILTAHHVGGDPQIESLKATDMALKPSIMETVWHIGDLKGWERRVAPAQAYLEDQYGKFQLPDIAIVRPADPASQKKFAQLPVVKIFTGDLKDLAGAQFFVLGFGKGNMGPAPALGLVNLSQPPANVLSSLQGNESHLIFSVASKPGLATVQSGDSGGPLLAKLPTGEFVIVGVASEAWGQSVGGFSPLSHDNIKAWLLRQLSEIGIQPYSQQTNTVPSGDVSRPQNSSDLAIPEPDAPRRAR